MNMREETIYGNDPASALRTNNAARRISWAAIFAGIVIALVMELLLTLLGVAIGATALNPATADQGTAQSFGIGAGLWMLLTGLISLFCGGWVAGRLCGFTRGGEGFLHGLVTWGAVTLLTLLLFSSALGGLLSGASGMFKGAMASGAPAAIAQGQGGMGSALQGAMGGGAGSGEMKQELQGLSKDPKALAAAGRLLAHSENPNPEDRQTVVQGLMAQQNMSESQANQTVDRWVQNAQTTKAQGEEKAREVGQKAAKGVSRAGWWSFAALALSGLVAALGGSKGARSFLRSRPGGIEVQAAA